MTEGQSVRRDRGSVHGVLEGYGGALCAVLPGEHCPSHPQREERDHLGAWKQPSGAGTHACASSCLSLSSLSRARASLSLASLSLASLSPVSLVTLSRASPSRLSMFQQSYRSMVLNTRQQTLKKMLLYSAAAAQLAHCSNLLLC